MSEDEEWRPVVGWEAYYEVSSLGRVRSLARRIVESGGRVRNRREKLRTATPSPFDGSMRLPLAADGRIIMVTVHSIVAAAFIGPRPEGADIAHGNGNAGDNRLSNLRYATRGENNADKKAHGTEVFGEKNARHVLKQKDVLAIRNSAADRHVLSRVYGVAPSTIDKVRKRETWRHLP